MSDLFFVSTIISLDFGIVPTIWLGFFSLYMLKLEFIQFDRITTHFMMNGKESHTYVFLNNAGYWVHYRKLF